MKQYLIVDCNDLEDPQRFWYGYFEGHTCYWSNWYPTITRAVGAKLKVDSSNRTLEEYCQVISSKWTITLLPGPITLETHPEYFL